MVISQFEIGESLLRRGSAVAVTRKVTREIKDREERGINRERRDLLIHTKKMDIERNKLRGRTTSGEGEKGQRGHRNIKNLKGDKKGKRKSTRSHKERKKQDKREESSQLKNPNSSYSLQMKFLRCLTPKWSINCSKPSKIKKS